MERLGVELAGELSPLLRTCIGTGIVLVSALAVLILALRWG